MTIREGVAKIDTQKQLLMKTSEMANQLKTRDAEATKLLSPSEKRDKHTEAACLYAEASGWTRNSLNPYNAFGFYQL